LEDKMRSVARGVLDKLLGCKELPATFVAGEEDQSFLVLHPGGSTELGGLVAKEVVGLVILEKEAAAVFHQRDAWRTEVQAKAFCTLLFV
jgi:hypothetical protein